MGEEILLSRMVRDNLTISEETQRMERVSHEEIWDLEDEAEGRTSTKVLMQD